MAFLTWNNQSDADASLAAVNVVYGCPVGNGYAMIVWSIVTKSDAAEEWGFDKPEARLNKTVAELEAVLIAGFTEYAQRPADWVAAE